MQTKNPWIVSSSKRGTIRVLGKHAGRRVGGSRGSPAVMANAGHRVEVRNCGPRGAARAGLCFMLALKFSCSALLKSGSHRVARCAPVPGLCCWWLQGAARCWARQGPPADHAVEAPTSLQALLSSCITARPQRHLTPLAGESPLSSSLQMKDPAGSRVPLKHGLL